MEELATLRPGPRVVMATLPSLEAGGARQLLTAWAVNPANLILFTGRAMVRPRFGRSHFSANSTSAQIRNHPA
jgi:hypothetical protein